METLHDQNIQKKKTLQQLTWTPDVSKYLSHKMKFQVENTQVVRHRWQDISLPAGLRGFLKMSHSVDMSSKIEES